MGMFDYVRCSGAPFVCPDGHDLSNEEFQTYDLDCTLGTICVTAERAWYMSGGIAPIPNEPISGELEIGCHCSACPCLVQAGTGNLVPTCVEFRVVVANGLVQLVSRTSPPSADQIAHNRAQPCMARCLGPMSVAEAAPVRRRIWDEHQAARAVSRAIAQFATEEG